MYNLNITPAVRNLLLINLGFFLMQIYAPALHLTELGSLFPIGSPYFYAWQFVTYMFLHASWGHIFSNMFQLVIFGPMMEQRWGVSRFLTFWLVCGFGAGLLYEGTRFYEIQRMEQAAIEFHQRPTGGDFAEFYRTNFPGESGYETLARDLQLEPQNTSYISAATQAVDAAVDEIKNSPHGGMLGASGAVFGLMFAFAYLLPNTEIYLMFIPIPIKAKYLVFFFGWLELYQGTHRVPGDNVAHFTHLAGMLIAFLIIKVWERDRQQFY